MRTPKILSISEVTEIERAYKHGVPSLGLAAHALLARWNNNLRDEETFIRLIFMHWYSCSEPNFLTGLEQESPSTEAFITGYGGEQKLSAETLFIIGLLGYDTFAFCFGEEVLWRRKCREFLERAATREPTSQLFSEWTYFIGEKSTTTNLKTKMLPEIHARFNGRGVLGSYVSDILISTLQNQYPANEKNESSPNAPKTTN